MRVYGITVLAGLMFLCMTSANAQVGADNFLSATSDKAANTNYYFARPNEITIVVNVIGFVQRPGRYEIATSIDLINLISLAGGPTADGALSKVKIIRTSREDKKYIRKEIMIDLDQIVSLNQEDLLLIPGDVIIVDRTSWSTFRDIFGVAVSAAVITTAIVQIINVTKD